MVGLSHGLNRRKFAGSDCYLAGRITVSEVPGRARPGNDCQKVRQTSQPRATSHPCACRRRLACATCSASRAGCRSSPSISALSTYYPNAVQRWQVAKPEFGGASPKRLGRAGHRALGSCAGGTAGPTAYAGDGAGGASGALRQQENRRSICVLRQGEDRPLQHRCNGSAMQRPAGARGCHQVPIPRARGRRSISRCGANSARAPILYNIHTSTS
eukprot:SAG31_NODE_2149_length_6331_cov_3.422657_3_plen_215_part_00